MSSNRTEFVFSARDQNVASVANRVRQSVVDSARSIISEGDKQNRSAQDTIKYLEEQIRLIDKKNRLEAQTSRVQIDQNYSAVKTANERYERDRQSAARDLRQKITTGASQEDIDRARERLNSIQKPELSTQEAKSRRIEATQELAAQNRDRTTEVNLLRELIQAVKSTGNTEIINDDDNTQRQLNEEERLQFIRDKGGQEFVDLSNKVHPPEPPDPNDKNKSRQRGGNYLLSGTESALGQRDTVAASRTAATALTTNPIVAALATATGIGMLALYKRAEREMAASNVAALTRGSVQGIVNSGIASTDKGKFGPLSLNVTRDEFLSQNMPQAIRAVGNLSPNAAYNRALKELELDKGQGLNPGQAAALDRMGRTMEGVSTAVGIYTQMLGATGANVGRGRYSELTQQYQSSLSNQFSRSGTMNPNQTLGLMHEFDQMGNLNKRYRDDQYKFQQINSIDQGLTSPGSSEATGIRMAMLRKRFPNATLMELQNEINKGLGSEGSLEDVMKFAKNTGGDKGSLQQLLSGMLGGNASPQTIIDMVNGLQKGTLKPSDITKNYGSRGVDVVGDATKASSKAQMQVEFTKEAMTDFTQKIGQAVSVAVEKPTETLYGVQFLIKRRLDEIAKSMGL